MNGDTFTLAHIYINIIKEEKKIILKERRYKIGQFMIRQERELISKNQRPRWTILYEIFAIQNIILRRDFE